MLHVEPVQNELDKQCSKIEELEKYPECWPAMVYLKIHLASGVGTRLRQKQAQVRMFMHSMADIGRALLTPRSG